MMRVGKEEKCPGNITSYGKIIVWKGLRQEILYIYMIAMPSNSLISTVTRLV